LKKILIIQTASIGDVILSTALAEKLHSYYPEAEINFLVKNGMDVLFSGHPFVKNVLVWNKKKDKYANLFRILLQVRSNHYDAVVNVQRFVSTGIITGLSGATIRAGFDKNPLSFLFNRTTKHLIGREALGLHETQRNQKLIDSLTDSEAARPALYPEQKDFQAVSQYKSAPYICIAPASLWNTKQFPADRWIELIRSLPSEMVVYLLGAPNDSDLCKMIKTASERNTVFDLSGALSLLQSAALIKDAKMNYVNDSAPLHIASSMNAPVTAVFCSTIPEFGFGPLSDNSFIIQTELLLPCRPCGIHGYNTCPEKHFNCAQTIHINSLLKTLHGRNQSI
jgi:heptosyltransferase-2